MYYQESENIITTTPEMRSEIKILDEFLGKTSGKQFSYQFMMANLGIKKNKLEALLSRYENLDVLTKYVIYNCPIHDTQIGDSNNEEPFRCEDCNEEYLASSCSTEIIYKRKKDPVTKIDKKEKIMPSYTWDVFISHSSADKPTVIQIINDFKKEGISYWVDHEQIEFGDRITEKIEDGLQKSKHIIICTSSNLGKSNWCKAEYGPILSRSISKQSDKKAIPLRLDNCTDDEIPALLYDIRRADYSNKQQFNELIIFLKK